MNTWGSPLQGSEMILKQLRLSRHLSQEQLAQMSGLNVRTIQRIESGHTASVESLKCLASVLEVDVSTLTQEKFTMDKKSDNWKRLPIWLKCWFFFNFLDVRPSRHSAKRIETISHATGFVFCLLGFVSEAALAGGLIMLATAYYFHFLSWQADRYGIWYEAPGVRNQ
jgi:transcriptional regulator with XRE-family HTH domain